MILKCQIRNIRYGLNSAIHKMINFILLFNRQRKIRLQKWYDVYSTKEKKNMIQDLTSTILGRSKKMSNILEWKNLQIIYQRYASLIIAFATSKDDNQLLTLEMIHRYVEILDSYFGNVCELDIIFNFEKAHFLLDEYILAGEVMDTGRHSVVNNVKYTDDYQEEELKFLETGKCR